MFTRTSSGKRGSERLALRRRSRRRRALLALAVFVLFSLGAAIYGLTQSAVRVAHIRVYGVPAEKQAALAALASAAIQGAHFGIVPRDSIFFVPEGSIRAAILDADPDIVAISIFRPGFTSLSIRVDKRVPVGRWCGLAPTEGVEAYCYFFDANGLIYTAVATTTGTVNSFVLYAPLVDDTLAPLGATVGHADLLPDIFNFARQLATLGSRSVDVSIRGDEVDIHLESGTRVTYVLGDEENAFTALISAKENFNISDGSIEYLDLRFDGRVYLKRKAR